MQLVDELGCRISLFSPLVWLVPPRNRNLPCCDTEVGGDENNGTKCLKAKGYKIKLAIEKHIRRVKAACYTNTYYSMRKPAAGFAPTCIILNENSNMHAQTMTSPTHPAYILVSRPAVYSYKPVAGLTTPVSGVLILVYQPASGIDETPSMHAHTMTSPPHATRSPA